MMHKYLAWAAVSICIAGILFAGGFTRFVITLGTGRASIYPAGFFAILALGLVLRAFKLSKDIR